MPLVVVANPKGGAGKSTLSTQIAGHWASCGHAVMLGDIDRQQSSRLWLQLRPSAARPIATWEAGPGHIVKPPKGTTHVVLDTPAGLHGKRLNEALKLAHKIIIPVQASIFDMYAVRAFVDALQAEPKAQGVSLGVVGMRVNERSIAFDKLQQFVQELGVPLLGHLRDTQNYVHLAARGLTVFDVTPSRVAKDLAQWEPICQWLDAP